MLSHFSRVQLCVTPIDRSPSGSPVPGILQARILEWVAISFSNAWKWKVKVKSFSHVRLLATLWTAAYQAPPSMGLSRQDDWSGVPLSSLIYIYMYIYMYMCVYRLMRPWWYFSPNYCLTVHLPISICGGYILGHPEFQNLKMLKSRI